MSGTSGWDQQHVDEYLKRTGYQERSAAPVAAPVVVPRITVCRVDPIGKPRMTRRDHWMKRPCVVAYWKYKLLLQGAFAGQDLSNVHTVSWTAYFSMPESWSKKKKDAMRGTSHYSKPDRDNVDKGILDALFENDSGIAHGEMHKYWDDGHGARLEIETK